MSQVASRKRADDVVAQLNRVLRNPAHTHKQVRRLTAQAESLLGRKLTSHDLRDSYARYLGELIVGRGGYHEATDMTLKIPGW